MQHTRTPHGPACHTLRFKLVVIVGCQSPRAQNRNAGTRPRDTTSTGGLARPQNLAHRHHCSHQCPNRAQKAACQQIVGRSDPLPPNTHTPTQQLCAHRRVHTNLHRGGNNTAHHGGRLLEMPYSRRYSNYLGGPGAGSASAGWGPSPVICLVMGGGGP